MKNLNLEVKKCFRCSQTIYQLELLGPVLGQVYHKSCFRCVFCDLLLDFKTFTTNTLELNDKHVYCKSHVPNRKNQYVFYEGDKQKSDDNVLSTSLNDTK